VKKDELKKDRRRQAPAEEKGRRGAQDDEDPLFRVRPCDGQAGASPRLKPDPKKPGWAQVSPDDKTVVCARGHNLFMMDEANYKLPSRTSRTPRCRKCS